MGGIYRQKEGEKAGGRVCELEWRRQG